MPGHYSFRHAMGLALLGGVYPFTAAPARMFFRKDLNCLSIDELPKHSVKSLSKVQESILGPTAQGKDSCQQRKLVPDLTSVYFSVS